MAESRPVPQPLHRDGVQQHARGLGAPVQEHAAGQHRAEARPGPAHRLQRERRCPSQHRGREAPVPGGRPPQREAVGQEARGRGGEGPQGAAGREDGADLALVQALREVVEAHEAREAREPAVEREVEPAGAVLGGRPQLGVGALLGSLERGESAPRRRGQAPGAQHARRLRGVGRERGAHARGRRLQLRGQRCRGGPGLARHRCKDAHWWPRPWTLHDNSLLHGE
mmetsp:Transcript_81109/g.229743  ORF Transcript_81109/g.229743 Transcript_81109/m.229743 type:complete len:226 (+) Transcript_81109:857-1534(+)